MKNNLILIAACSKNRVIGNKGSIPWDFKTDRNFYKSICTNKTVIMGRNTFEEINRPLPYCKIIVLSKTLKTAPFGCILCKTLDEAILLCSEDAIIAGGENLYKQTISFAKKIYLTIIDKQIEGDRYFPLFDEKEFTSIEKTSIENGITLHFIEYTRKN
jgi:dihydrofolate reductase (trimethoprim resistance protein)